MYDDSLIRFLEKYAQNHGIEFAYGEDEPDITFSCVKCPEKVVIINPSWNHPTQIPFAIAHEIGHLIHDDFISHVQGAPAASTKMEWEATEFAIGLISYFAYKNGYQFDSIYTFARAFGIPFRYLEHQI